MSDVFSELQGSYFFYPRTDYANNQEDIPYQPILWKMFTSVIDKNNKISYRNRKINSKSRFSFKLWEDMLSVGLFHFWFVNLRWKFVITVIFVNVTIVKDLIIYITN